MSISTPRQSGWPMQPTASKLLTERVPRKSHHPQWRVPHLYALQSGACTLRTPHYACLWPELHRKPFFKKMAWICLQVCVQDTCSRCRMSVTTQHRQRTGEPPAGARHVLSTHSYMGTAGADCRHRTLQST